jgi:hypothetical protein
MSGPKKGEFCTALSLVVPKSPFNPKRISWHSGFNKAGLLGESHPGLFVLLPCFLLSPTSFVTLASLWHGERRLDFFLLPFFSIVFNASAFAQIDVPNPMNGPSQCKTAFSSSPFTLR